MGLLEILSAVQKLHIQTLSNAAIPPVKSSNEVSRHLNADRRMFVLLRFTPSDVPNNLHMAESQSQARPH